MGNSAEEKIELKDNGGTKMDNEVVEDQLMKPFSLGWRREVVMRVITGSNVCDIYYLHPSGKKLRSMTEVKANLTDGLTLDCFTFKKKPLNVSSEIVRKATVRGHHNKKAKPVKQIVKANSKAQIRSKLTRLKKAEKNNYLRAGTRRQMLMKKKEQQRSILQTKKLRKTKSVPEKKNRKKTAEKAPKEATNYVKSTRRQDKSETRNKSAQALLFNGVQCKIPEPTTTHRLKFESVSAGRKRECNDIRSIVQRNIGKYRELRRKQIKEGLRERARSNISYKVVRRPRSSEPISKNLEIYLKPLEKGWRRELVHRVNGPDAAGRSDVYYFHPNGKKLRSTREIADNLTQGLTIECFTFRKEPLGCGEPQEVIRNARLNKSYIPPNKKKVA